MATKRNMIVVDGGAAGRPFVEVVAGARVALRVDVPNRGIVRWSLLASPPGSVQTFESATDRSTGLQTVVGDIANMYVVRLDVDAGKETASFDVVVLGMPDERNWVIPAFPVASADGQVEPAFTDVEQSGLIHQPATDPWNFTWGMRRILNDLRGLFGGDSGGGDILWQWNNEDMTQFGPALKPSALFFEYVFAGTPECTVVSRPEGNRIRIYVPGTGITSRGVVYLPIATSEQLALPERYIIEYSLIDGVIDGNLYGGVAYFCNGQVATAEDIRAVVALNACSGGVGWQGVISETTWYPGVGAEYQLNSPGHTPPGGGIPCFVRIEVKGRKPAGDQPGALINVASHGDGSDGGACYRFDESTHFVQPWPAGWDDLTAADINQAGLILFANAAIDNPYVEFGHLRILRHPLDMV